MISRHRNTWRLQYTYGRDVVGYWQLRLTSRCRHPAPGQDLIPLQRLHVFAHSRDPHPAIKLWCQVPFTKSKTTFQIEMYCMQCSLKSSYIKNRTFNDKNRWIIKRVMVFKKLLQHLATRGTYSPGDWRCDEAWREQTLVYPPVMCQQRLIYCTRELNVMMKVDNNNKLNVKKVTRKHCVCLLTENFILLTENVYPFFIIRWENGIVVVEPKT